MTTKTEREREIDAISAELDRISRVIERAATLAEGRPERRALIDEAETVQRDCRRRVDALRGAAA